MKKIFITIILFSFGVVSCDFLIENPTTSLSKTSVFDSEPALEAQLNSAYGAIYSHGGTSCRTLAYCSPLVHWKSYSREGLDYQQYLQGSFMATQTTGKGVISGQYSHLYTCNTLLDGLRTSPVDEDYKREVEAEARFIRAFIYFQLVRLFGDLPLYTSAPKNEAEYNIKRSSFKDVYELIVNDLLFAEKHMRTHERQQAINGVSIRAQKYAATALKAKVYAQIGSLLSSPDDQAFGTVATGEVKPDFTHMGITSAKQAWELALEAADKVIKESGYALEDDYRNLFRWDMAGHPEDFDSRERILVAQYSPNCNMTNYMTAQTLPAYFVGTSNYSTKNTSYMNLVPSRYLFQRWAATHGGEKGTGEGNKNIYVNCKDPRFDASFIYDIFYSYLTSDGQAPEAGDGQYERTGCYPNNAYINTGHWKGSPAYRKYFTPTFDMSPGHAGIYVMRFAEMFFIAAEACAWAGTTGEYGDSYDYIEFIHDRARKSVDEGQPEAEFPKWTKGQHGYGEELITELFWEKMYEMCGEGHEWYDTHRYGAKWIVKNIYYPNHDFLLLPEQATPNPSGISYNMLWWYQRGLTLPLTIRNARATLLCEYPEYEISYNTALTDQDQNFFTHSTGDFYNVGSTGNSGGNNSNFDDDYEFEW